MRELDAQCERANHKANGKVSVEVRSEKAHRYFASQQRIGVELFLLKRAFGGVNGNGSNV